MIEVRQVIEQILRPVQRELTAADAYRVDGRDPILPYRYLLGSAAAATLVAVGLLVSDLWYLRTGRRQRVAVDTRAAALSLFRQSYLRRNGAPAGSLWRGISGFYETKDHRWIQLHCNFPHHEQGVVRWLGCDADRGSVAAAVAAWDGEELESALSEAGMCAGLVRSRREWEQHPQCAAVGGLPLLEVLPIGESPAEPLAAAPRPLSGIRVLDLTRVIAGPVGGRILAEHGAEVMRIASPRLPSIEELVIDTGFGKLSAHLDLDRDADREKLLELIRGGDVFLQGYRPGALSRRGLSPESLAALRPGIVYASLSAYGHAGPWRERRGYDSLVQSVSGMVDEVSEPGRPRHLPAQVLDYISGYLLALGVMAALARRAREGGSYLVRVSLCQTEEWLQRLGRLDRDTDFSLCPALGRTDVQDLLVQSRSPFGALEHVAPVLQMSETPARWERPTVPLGTHAPEWPGE